MAFDWFTLVAQLVNFGLLLLLLRLFLYRPVLRVMDEREKRLADAWDQIRDAEAAAAAEASQHARARAEVERRSDELLARARADADAARARMLTDARREAAQELERQRAGFEEGTDRLVEALAQESARLVVTEVEATLRDLAAADVDERAARVFTERLGALTGEQRNDLAAAARQGTLVLTTAAPADEAARSRLTDAVATASGMAASPHFRVDPHLLFGVELAAGALSVAVSGRARLDALNSAFAAALHEAVPSATPTGSGAPGA